MRTTLIILLIVWLPTIALAADQELLTELFAATHNREGFVTIPPVEYHLIAPTSGTA